MVFHTTGRRHVMLSIVWAEYMAGRREGAGQVPFCSRYLPAAILDQPIFEQSEAGAISIVTWV